MKPARGLAPVKGGRGLAVDVGSARARVWLSGRGLVLDAPTGPESVRGGIAMIRRSFPDLHADMLDLIAEGDRVAVFLQLRGTNEGDYRRGAATRREGSFRAFFIWRVANGRLVENWGVADRFALLQQLGIIPSDDDLADRMPSPGAPG